MEIIQLLLGMVFLNVVYHTGQLLWALRWDLHHQHYFIGRGPKLFTFRFRGMHFTVGIYIPLFGLAKIYEYESGVKKRAWSSWEFSETPVWKRFTAALGGVFSLLLSGILIFIYLAYLEKEYFISRDEINKYGIYPSELAIEAGFRQGDRILRINGREYESFKDLLSPKEGTVYTLSREGFEQELLIDREIAEKAAAAQHIPFLSVWAPFKISAIMPNATAEYIGLKPGDQIKQVNHYPIISLDEFKRVISLDEDGTIDLLVQREDSADAILFSEVAVDEEGKLGFFSEEVLQYSSRQNSISSAIQKGFARAYSLISSNIRGFYSLFSGSEIQSSKKVKSPVGISEIYGDQYLWQRFWSISAMFALWISFLNLLPLPNTAFWQLIPLLYETFSRKIFPYQAYLKIKRFGFYAAILLMASVLMSDLFQLFF
jgi:regulator of sigma E protease